MTPYVEEQLEVLRRIAERGKAFAETNEQYAYGDYTHDKYIDLFVHLLDELKRLKNELE